MSTASAGGHTLSFEYNGDGIRTAKTADGVKHDYITGDNRLLQETWGSNKIEYLYDDTGTIFSLYYNGAKFYLIKNLQGDVVELRNSTNGLVARYTYDAYGKCTSVKDSSVAEITDASNIALINPIRYRGYYFDSETGLYYVSSRYYDPEIGRWVNADDQLTIGSDLTGTNLFAYCGNNPVNRIDPTGEAWWHWALGAVVVAACALATVVTAGGFAAAAGAVAAVGSGVAAATTTSTVAAGAFIGSATVYGMAVAAAASTSSSVKAFNDQGNWGTVAATAGGAVLGGAGGYVMSKSQTPTTTGRGTQNPKVKAAVQKGQAMHKQMNYGPGVVKEKTIAPGCRVDGIDFNNRIIYELKPNNPQAIARGISQLNRYTAEASQQYGGTWTGVLKLYD